jgi:hypothetical protein
MLNLNRLCDAAIGEESADIWYCIVICDMLQGSPRDLASRILQIRDLDFRASATLPIRRNGIMFLYADCRYNRIPATVLLASNHLRLIGIRGSNKRVYFCRNT